MENASKALIIAGAILLSILIIGLGMYIYTQAKGVIGNNGLDSTKAQTYNQPFTQYEGTRTGTDTRALVQEIINHNREYQDDPSQQIAIKTGTAPETVEEPAEAAVTGIKVSDYKAGYTYKITFSYSKSNYVTFCYIQRVTGSGNNGGQGPN